MFFSDSEVPLGLLQSGKSFVVIENIVPRITVVKDVFD